jgi:hypothetical protein
MTLATAMVPRHQVDDVSASRPGVVDIPALSAELRVARARVATLERRQRAVYGGAEVAVLCWPAEEGHVEQLDGLGLPRLLVVGTHADSVAPMHELQRVIHVPVTDIDVHRELLQLRTDAENRPVLDGTGRLHYRGGWVVLSFTEERLARPLVRSFLEVVGYEKLTKVGWPSGAPSENGRRLMMGRLRERCRDVGLDLITIRGRGCLLADSNSVQSAPRPRRLRGTS